MHSVLIKGCVLISGVVLYTSLYVAGTMHSVLAWLKVKFILSFCVVPVMLANWQLPEGLAWVIIGYGIGQWWEKGSWANKLICRTVIGGALDHVSHAPPIISTLLAMISKAIWCLYNMYVYIYISLWWYVHEIACVCVCVCVCVRVHAHLVTQIFQKLLSNRFKG